MNNRPKDQNFSYTSRMWGQGTSPGKQIVEDFNRKQAAWQKLLAPFSQLSSPSKGLLVEVIEELPEEEGAEQGPIVTLR